MKLNRYFKNSAHIIPHPMIRGKFVVECYMLCLHEKHHKYLYSIAFRGDSIEECKIWCDMNGLESLPSDGWLKVSQTYTKLWNYWERKR